MSAVVIFPTNILAEGVTTVTGTADTGYPESRLYDRSPDLYWKVTAGATDYTIEVDASMLGDDFGYDGDVFGMIGDDFGIGLTSGASYAVELLYVTGHNFHGKQIYWEYDTGAGWIEAWAVVVSGSDPVVRTLAVPIMAKTWRLRVMNIVNPTASEVWMGRGYSFDVLAKPNPVHTEISNANWFQNIGGGAFSVKKGDQKLQVDYNVSIDGAELLAMKEIFIQGDGYSKPFIVKNKDGDYYFMYFPVPPSWNFYNNNETLFDLTMQEI